MSEKLNTTVNTPMFRVSYPNLFTAKLNNLNKKMEFSVEAIFAPETEMSEKDKKALADLKTAARNAIINNWGADEKLWPKNFRAIFRKHEEKEKNGALPDGLKPGGLWLRLKNDGTKSRPAIVDQNRQEIIEEHKMYAGCYARANVTASAYPRKGAQGAAGVQPGVSFYLNAVQLVKDGEPFSGRPSVEDAFEAIDVEGSPSDQSAQSMFE